MLNGISVGQIQAQIRQTSYGHKKRICYIASSPFIHFETQKELLYSHNQTKTHKQNHENNRQ